MGGTEGDSVPGSGSHRPVRNLRRVETERRFSCQGMLDSKGGKGRESSNLIQGSRHALGEWRTDDSPVRDSSYPGFPALTSTPDGRSGPPLRCQARWGGRRIRPLTRTESGSPSRPLQARRSRSPPTSIGPRIRSVFLPSTVMEPTTRRAGSCSILGQSRIRRLPPIRRGFGLKLKASRSRRMR